MDNKLPFMMHFDYFMENFSLILMKFRYQFSIAQPSFNFIIKFNTKRYTAKELYLFIPMPFYCACNGKIFKFIYFTFK